jgi:hypothetical protein
MYNKKSHIFREENLLPYEAKKSNFLPMKQAHFSTVYVLIVNKLGGL